MRLKKSSNGRGAQHPVVRDTNEGLSGNARPLFFTWGENSGALRYSNDSGGLSERSGKIRLWK